MRDITLLQIFRTHHVLDDDRTLYEFFDRCVCHVMDHRWGVSVTDKLYARAGVARPNEYAWVIKPEGVVA